jgi:hypothetical protein
MTARFEPVIRERIRRAGLVLLAATVSIGLIGMLVWLPADDVTGLARFAWVVLAVPGFLFAVGAALGARSARARPLGALMSLAAVTVFGLMAAQAVPGVPEEVLRPEPDGRLLVAVLALFVLVTLAALTFAVHVSDRIAVVVAAGIAPLAFGIAVTGVQIASLVPRCPMPSAPSGAAGQLAFAFRGFICIADLDAGTVHAVTSGESPALVTSDPAAIGRHPALSPDGRALAFDMGGELWVSRLGGDEAPTRIGPGEEPAWSPDSRTIVVVDHSRNAGTILLFDVVSGTRRTLDVPAKAGPALGAPAWSPHGDVIAVVMQSGSLWLLDARTGEGRVLIDPDNDQWVDAPVWRPDGKALAFDRFGSGSSGIRIVDVADGTQRDLVIADGPGPDPCFDPAWSPDGRYIACIDVVSSGQGPMVIVDVATGAWTSAGLAGATPAWGVSRAVGP